MHNMNLNVQAETKEEKEIETYLTLLHNSSEVKAFMNEMEEFAKEQKVFKYRARIKDVKSAIRTYRINHKPLSEVSDYMGLTFMVDTEEKINPIVDYLHKRLSNVNDIDLVAEDMAYSPLIWIKWLPPLTYNLFAKEELISGARPVPIEIRICSKEGFISEQAAYYSLHKNDYTGLELKVKQNLKDIAQHLTYKLAIIANRNLSEDEMDIEIRKLHQILNSQRIFLLSNWNLIEEAIIDCGMLIYKIQNDKSVSEDEASLSKEDMLKIEDEIKKVFWDNFEKVPKENYFEMTPDGNYKANLEDTFLNASKFMKSISYEEIRKNVLNS